MPRARKPFKSFSANRYVFAVKITEENIEDVARQLGGVKEVVVREVKLRAGDYEDQSFTTLRLPGLYEPLIVDVGQYLVVTDILEDTGAYVYGVQDEEQFEKDWTVPNGLLQTRAKAEYEAEQEAKTD